MDCVHDVTSGSSTEYFTQCTKCEDMYVLSQGEEKICEGMFGVKMSKSV